VGAAELLDRGGLAGGGGPGDDQAAAGADLALVEQALQPALVEDLPDRRGRDHDQLGVVRDPGLVVLQPGGILKRVPVGVGKQGEGR
jgi:hypothetical protein